MDRDPAGMEPQTPERAPVAHDEVLDVRLHVEQDADQRDESERGEVQPRKIDLRDDADIYVAVQREPGEGLGVRCEGAEDSTLHHVLPKLDERVL